MIAFCGLDCEKCDAYIATKNDDQALREKTAKLWAELNNAPILPGHINCDGCRVNGRKTVFCESLCGIRQCALKKGVTTCGDCPEMAFATFIVENGITEFFIAGADATACVKSTCFNMRKAGYTVHVLSDCITSYDLKKLPEMFAYYAKQGCEVMTLELRYKLTNGEERS